MPNTDGAVRFLRKCMRGQIKPDDGFLPELTIPEDIGECIVLADDPERSALAGTAVKSVMLGQFYLGTYSGDPEDEETSTAPDALHRNIRVLMEYPFQKHLRLADFAVGSAAAGRLRRKRSHHSRQLRYDRLHGRQ